MFAVQQNKDNVYLEGQLALLVAHYKNEAHTACRAVSNNVLGLWPRDLVCLPAFMKPWQANKLVVGRTKP